MHKVFIVFHGTYSDRTTSAVFYKEQAANHFIENNRRRETDGSHSQYDDWDIEEWEVNSEERLIRASVWIVHMFKNGTVVYVGREPNSTKTGFKFAMHWDSDGMGRYTESKLICTCEAEDEKHAIKITNDKRAMLIANDDWPAKV